MPTGHRPFSETRTSGGTGGGIPTTDDRLTMMMMMTVAIISHIIDHYDHRHHHLGWDGTWHSTCGWCKPPHPLWYHRYL
jgi:hypothetical protein